MSNNVLAVIPARYDSERFPGKMLANILGKTMIQRVYNRVTQCKTITGIVVATDDMRILDEVKSWGGDSILTSKNHNSGTDRVGEVASIMSHFDHYINVQGDEVNISPLQIDKLVDAHVASESQISTQCKMITSGEDLFNYHVVKVVRNHFNKALYFSRQAIPAQRDLPYRDWVSGQIKYYKHVGLYCFSSQALKKISALPPGILESAEKLEQLRWIENGFDIQCFETEYDTVGVDTREDIDRAIQAIIKENFDRN
jgi:3-deoxy-manno-octulosonate cytidylyltransferase (CMP-KDO synthetase)